MQIKSWAVWLHRFEILYYWTVIHSLQLSYIIKPYTTVEPEGRREVENIYLPTAESQWRSGEGISSSATYCNRGICDN